MCPQEHASVYTFLFLQATLQKLPMIMGQGLKDTPVSSGDKYCASMLEQPADQTHFSRQLTPF